MIVGLRVDVDTFRGTKLGVPTICRILEKHSIKASFFFSVGPDNMGRHLWRLLKPVFLWKMLRTKAASLYGWDIIFKGTFWPGPLIGKHLATIIRDTAKAGHEIGLHAWDHHAWQAHMENMDEQTIFQAIKQGYDSLQEIVGNKPTCSAVPAWQCNDATLLAKSNFTFIYNSDCRGSSIFYPQVGNEILKQPQIPVTMPTYDEVIGKNGVTNENYNQFILSQIKQDSLNVLTIHAEAEGISCAAMFEDFLIKAEKAGAVFVPLGNLLKDSPSPRISKIVRGQIRGRQGWLSCQA